MELARGYAFGGFKYFFLYYLAMNIANICNQIDIAGLAVYTNKVNSGLRYMAMRKYCIEAGEDVTEKDHLYGFAELIVKGLVAGQEGHELKKACVLHFADQEIVDHWQVIGVFESGSGFAAIKRRGELVESLRGSGRGVTAFQVSQSAEGKRYEALISNGKGRVISSHKAGFIWNEKPSLRQCVLALSVAEYNISNALVRKELDRQCNLQSVVEFGIKAGEVVEGYVETGCKARKIKIIDISHDGHVKFEILAPGIKEGSRVKKELEARFLKVNLKYESVE
jgi:hypothetical protein